MPRCCPWRGSVSTSDPVRRPPSVAKVALAAARGVRTAGVLCLWLCGGGCSKPGPPPPDHTSLLPGGVPLEFVRIDSGTFTMGSPRTEPARDADEGPMRQITIAHAFDIGRTEVTQAQWTAVTGARPWSGLPFVREGAEYPAVGVAWSDAVAFTRRLTELLGDAVYRLPTEAEWEYACRAGTSTRWSFGDDLAGLDDHAWHAGNTWDAGERYGHAVATRAPNPWGLFDMHGNVNEWVLDRYDPAYYASAPAVNPPGPEAGRGRVYRGGYFHNNGARRLRSANRMYYDPAVRVASIGLRVVRLDDGG